MRKLYVLAVVIASLGGGEQAWSQTPLYKRPLIRVRLGGEWIQGAPWAMENEHLWLITPQGKLVVFAPHEVSRYESLGRRFLPATHAQLAAWWARRLGPGLSTATTQHFVVFHPRSPQRWAETFERVFRAFWRYFSVRGFRLQKPPFPLVAVVFRSSEQYHRVAQALGEAIPSWSAGFYSPTSNLVMFFQEDLNPEDPNTLARLVHEVTHQAAYNTGVHDRVRGSPRWVVEGLATMFEVPGVWSSTGTETTAQRIHPHQLEVFRSSLRRNGRSAWLTELVARDGPFRSNPDLAYAQAWALSFYLAETRGRKYAAYLKLSIGQEHASAKKRLKTFTRVFGANLNWLQADLERFYKQFRNR